MIKAPVFSILLGGITLLILVCVSRLMGWGLKDKTRTLQKHIYTHGLIPLYVVLEMKERIQTLSAE